MSSIAYLVDAAWTETWGTISDLLVAGFTVAATTGVYLVLRQVRLQQRQLHRDLENLYVERYWGILDRLEESEIGTPQRARAIRAYLALSEDQCDMRALGRVTDETWAVWGSSIHQQISDPEFSDALDRAPDVQFRQLREMQRRGAEYDPSDLSRRQREKLGL